MLLFLPLTRRKELRPRLRQPPCAASAGYACYSGAFLRVWDPKVQPAIADEWNVTVQHQFAGNTTVQVGYVGQRGVHLMVPFDYAQRALLPNSSCATPPCTAPSPYFAANPALYSVLGGGTPTSGTPGAEVSGTKSNGTMRYNSLQAVLQKQTDSRVAVSSRIYLLQVHVR